MLCFFIFGLIDFFCYAIVTNTFSGSPLVLTDACSATDSKFFFVTDSGIDDMLDTAFGYIIFYHQCRDYLFFLEFSFFYSILKFPLNEYPVKRPTVTDYIRLVLPSLKGLNNAKPVIANLHQYT